MNYSETCPDTGPFSSARSVDVHKKRSPPGSLHWSLQLLELFFFMAPSNSHFERNCGFLSSRPTDGIILGCCSTGLKDVGKES